MLWSVAASPRGTGQTAPRLDGPSAFYPRPRRPSRHLRLHRSIREKSVHRHRPPGILTNQTSASPRATPASPTSPKSIALSKNLTRRPFLSKEAMETIEQARLCPQPKCAILPTAVRDPRVVARGDMMPLVHPSSEPSTMSTAWVCR